MKKLIFLFAAVLLSTAQLYSQWVNVPNGLSTNQEFWSMASNGNNLFACNYNGVYISTNDGANWSLTSLNKQGNVLLVDGSNIYAGTDLRVYVSSNNGQNWSQMGTDSVVAVWGLAKYGDTIFAGSVRGVYRTTNNGQNWVQTLTNKNISSLAINGNYIFAGDWGESKVWVSSNNGSNWISTSLSNFNAPVFCLAVKNNIVFAGTDNQGIYITTNNGLNWTQSGLNYASINSIKINGNNIFAGELFYEKGVYLSTNNGVNWIHKDQGMGSERVWSLTTNSQYIFSGTDNSVWRRSLAEIVGVRNISTEVPSAYSLKQNYPNPFNPSTNIRYSVPKNGMVKLAVFDALGREVHTLVNESLQPGTYETSFNGSALTSGVYFYKLTSGDFSETKRMLLIK
jgi:hypothetical protein